MEKIPVKFALMGDKIIGYMGLDDVFEPKLKFADFIKSHEHLRHAMRGCFATVSRPIDMNDGTKVCHLYAAKSKSERTIFAF